eukprot:c16393_g1_i1 orf=302-1042(-)
MGKGKGRRRRRANYLAAHGGNNNLLALPPDANDVTAIPAKLRRIMALKARSTSAGALDVDSCDHKSRNKDNLQVLKKESGIPLECTPAIYSGGQTIQALQGNLQHHVHCQQDTLSGSVVEEPLLKTKKRNRGESLDLIMQKLGVTAVQKGLSERKKRYLKEKKKRRMKTKKPLLAEIDSCLRQEEVRFGDVVQEPPKLPHPKKSNNIFQERIRLQAIETYRQKKKWLSRPGQHQPAFVARDAIPAI